MLSLTETLQAFKDRSLNNAVDEKAKRLVNSYIKEILGTTGLPFSYGYRTFQSEANVQSYEMAADCNKVVSVSFKNAELVRNLRILNSQAEFDAYRVSTMSSNFPYVGYYDGLRLHMYPYPSSANTTFNIKYEKRVPDLNFNDVNLTGITVTRDSRTVIGSGFVNTYIGKSFRSEDGLWYTIEDVVSPSSILLSTKYLGRTTAGTTATVAVLVPLPDGYELLPIYKALRDYYMSDEGKLSTSKMWGNEAIALQQQLEEEFNTPSDNIAGSAVDITPNIPGFFVYN